MKILNVILCTAFVILFSGCASMYVPDNDLISKMPITINVDQDGGEVYVKADLKKYTVYLD